VDAALSRNSRFLYVLSEGDGSIIAYRVGLDGSLTLIGSFAITAGPAIFLGGPFPNGLAAQ
jgi:6-phosphogluconolactonase (cycloisomerase 2 family)